MRLKRDHLGFIELEKLPFKEEIIKKFSDYSKYLLKRIDKEMDSRYILMKK